MKFNLCKYKNIFGEPKKGIHSYRIFNIAIIDFILTIILGIIISYFTKIKKIYCIISLFIFGIIMHHLFCVNTTINNLIFTKYNT